MNNNTYNQLNVGSTRQRLLRLDTLVDFPLYLTDYEEIILLSIGEAIRAGYEVTKREVNYIQQLRQKYLTENYYGVVGHSGRQYISEFYRSNLIHAIDFGVELSTILINEIEKSETPEQLISYSIYSLPSDKTVDELRVISNGWDYMKNNGALIYQT